MQEMAEQGDPGALGNLAYFYERGIGAQQSDRKAFYWYQKAAQQNVRPAQMSVGYAYEKGKGVGQSYSKAAAWYEKAANSGNGSPVAMFNVGTLYARGAGVENSLTRSTLWYLSAYSSGYEDAAKELAENARQLPSVKVTKPVVNMRSGSGTGREIVENLTPDRDVRPLAEPNKGDWYMVYRPRHHDFGYVHRSVAALR